MHTLHCPDKMRNSIFAKPIGMAISEYIEHCANYGENECYYHAVRSKEDWIETNTLFLVLCLSVVIALTIYGMFG